MEYIFKKGEFNKLHDLNQNMKYIFTKYSLYNGYVFGEFAVENGKHYAKVDYKVPDLPDDIIITIDSVRLFTTQKDYKKNIIGYRIENEDFYLMMNDMDDIIIGSAISYNGLAGTRKKVLLSEASSIIDSPGEYLRLSDADMDNLLVYKTKITVKYDKFKVFLTKDIIPNVKKNDYLDIAFSETNVNSVFQMIIRINRGGTTMTYHVYRCLYI